MDSYVDPPLRDLVIVLIPGKNEDEEYKRLDTIIKDAFRNAYPEVMFFDFLAVGGFQTVVLSDTVRLSSEDPRWKGSGVRISRLRNGRSVQLEEDDKKEGEGKESEEGSKN
ncbi:hypothetical protein PRZ48_000887 [Zasmidium cellare]|uniref:Uncharacterized protein n=1 Tax=Zasmidium cellare TaxID=395010 RepID=A0ABR0F124_ZASCE|nr:hypothetical protein PRZ48_000887 [Zasmidium cellare]